MGMQQNWLVGLTVAPMKLATSGQGSPRYPLIQRDVPIIQDSRRFPPCMARRRRPFPPRPPHSHLNVARGWCRVCGKTGRLFGHPIIPEKFWPYIGIHNQEEFHQLENPSMYVWLCERCKLVASGELDPKEMQEAYEEHMRELDSEKD